MKDTDIKKNGGIYFGKLPIESRNSYGEKYNPQLYYSPNFKMYTFPTAPLFKSTHKDNYIYHISDEGVLGVNMLEVCAWKFSVDDTKVKLFGNDDSLRLSEESKDFIKIENGLNKNAIKMRLGNPGIDADFTLNLGQSGEILVDNNVASELKKQYLYKTILTLKYDNGQDTMHIFEDVPLEWKGIKIEHCLVGNKPNFFYKQNFIGAKLMHRFNSILSFVFENEDYDDRDLYIQPSKDFNTFKCEPIIAFGMNIGIKDNCMKVVNLEEGGIAARNGIKLGDEILQIDSCTFEGKDIKNKFMQYAANKKEIKIQLKDRSVVLK
ncbi:MAG: hypothetical protein LUE99_14800 [Bacteroides sp.]|nr:hypothetical protein [Bacteroides sp.]